MTYAKTHARTHARTIALTLAIAAGVLPTASLKADDLYKDGSFAALASDQRASQVGDVLTILISQSSRAATTAQQSSRKRSDLGGGVAVAGVDESADLSLRGGYSGTGEARRSDQLVATISVGVTGVLPNGDLLVSGRHNLLVNGERTLIGVRGQVRVADIQSGNVVPSSRIAEAAIDYDGQGFVSRSAKPGLVNRILSFLGLG